MNGIIPMDADARFALTLYRGRNNPIPVFPFDRYGALSWQEVVDLVAGGNAPKIISNKANVLYMTSGVLSEGLLNTETTRNHYGTETGRARLTNCCLGPARLMLFDIDGVDKSQTKALIKMLDGAGLNYVLYSTHSHGAQGESGYRFRGVVPLSEGVGSSQYTSIHCAVRQDLFACTGGAFDDHAKRLTQQQGTWATSADRARLAFKRRRDHGGCLDVNYWLARAVELGVDVTPYVKPEFQPPSYRSPAELGVIARRVAKALEMIPSRTTLYQEVLMYTKAADLGDDGFELFNGWAWSDPEHQAEQQARRDVFNPEIAWPSAKPSMPAEAAVGSICKLAKECALGAIDADPTFSKDSTGEALAYLCANHPKDFTRLAQRSLQNTQQSSHSGAAYA